MRVKQFASWMLAVLLLTGAAVLPAGADAPASAPIPVEFVSTNDTKQYEGFAPANIFLNDLSEFKGLNSSEGVTVTGQFSETFVITRIGVLTSATLSNRTRNAYLEASADGTTWETLAQQSNASSKQEWFYFDITSQTPYRYVRIRQNIAYKNYDFALCRLVFEGYAQAEEQGRLSVSFAETNSTRDATHTFLDDAIDYHAQGVAKPEGGYEPIYVTGSLAEASKIEKIKVRTPAVSQARSQKVKILGSADGENWVQLAAMPSSGLTASTDYEFQITDDTLFRYIQVRQADEYAKAGYWFGIGSVLVYGVPGSELDTPAMFRGHQRTVLAEQTYGLRFLATVDDLRYDEVGFDFSIRVQDGTAYSYSVPVTTVYGSVTGLVDGRQEQITAESLGGKYLYSVAFRGIGVPLGLVSFDVTPYVVEGGVKKTGRSEQVIYNCGEYCEFPSETDLAGHLDQLKVNGRSLATDAGIACDFSASGIEFRALCAGDLILNVTADAACYFTLYVNGVRRLERLRFESGTADYRILTDLPAGEYHISLVKQTHVAHALCTLNTLRMRGELLDAPQDSRYLIEFVGDSITCGYGVVNYPSAGVTYYGTPEFCDATQAYAYLTAQELGADASMIAVSGWSLLPSAPGAVEGCVPAVYGQTSWRRSDEVYTPARTADLVVINLGTNDVSTRENYETDFVAGAVAFAAQVRALNPNAKIIWAYGAMMKDTVLTGFAEKIQAIVDELGGETNGVYAVQIAYNQSAGNGHPSADGHAQSAEILTGFIREHNLLP